MVTNLQSGEEGSVFSGSGAQVSISVRRERSDVWCKQGNEQPAGQRSSPLIGKVS